MKVFETTMRKNPSRQDYTIGIRKSENVDESKFIDNKCDVVVLYKEDYDFKKTETQNKNDEIKALKQRINELEDEVNEKTQSNQSSTSQYYEKLDELQNRISDLKKENSKLEEKHENELSAIGISHKKEIKEITNEFNEKIDKLNKGLSAKDGELKQMELKYEGEISALNETHLKKINTLEKTHAKEIQELKNEIANLKQSNQAEKFETETSIIADKQKIIDGLKDEISDLKDEMSALTEDHLKKINTLEKTHTNKVHELEQKYQGTLVKLRTTDYTDLSNQIKGISSVKNELEKLGFFEKHSKKYGLLIDELGEGLDEIEKTNESKLMKVDEDFEKLPLNEVNEDSERND